MTAAAEHPPRSNIPNERIYRCRLLGVNGADPTKEVGPGVTATRTSEGIYKFAWATNPGRFIGVGGFVFGDTTPGDVKNKILARDTYQDPTATASGHIELHIFESGTLDDLEATEYLDVSFVFSEGGL